MVLPVSSANNNPYESFAENLTAGLGLVGAIGRNIQANNNCFFGVRALRAPTLARLSPLASLGLVSMGIGFLRSINPASQMSQDERTHILIGDLLGMMSIGMSFVPSLKPASVIMGGMATLVDIYFIGKQVSQKIDGVEKGLDAPSWATIGLQASILVLLNFDPASRKILKNSLQGFKIPFHENPLQFQKLAPQETSGIVQVQLTRSHTAPHTSQEIFLPPENAFITRGNETHVRVKNNEWAPIHNNRPGAFLVQRDKIIQAISLEDLRAGEFCVTGDTGIRRMVPPSKDKSWGFMTSEGTTEQFQEAQMLRVAAAIQHARQNNGKVAFVLGPALGHSDASKYVGALIRAGLIDILITGNAFATHDLEMHYTGTSLGSSPIAEFNDSVRGLPGGNECHLRTINEMRRVGSLEGAIDAGLISENSAIRAAIERGIKIVYQGSIRDDGPLPGVITDHSDSLATTRKALEGVDLVVGVGTYLHTGGVFQNIPSTTATVCVDPESHVFARLAKVKDLNHLNIKTNGLHFFTTLLRAFNIPSDHLLNPTPRREGSFIRVEGDPTQPVDYERVTRAGVAPANAYLTSNENTTILLSSYPVRVGHPKMDATIAIRRGGRVETTVFNALEVGDEVVIGRNGIRTTPVEDNPLKTSTRPMQDLAGMIRAEKEDRKGIYLVAGHALVESDAHKDVAALIENGTITKIHTTFALAVSEVEKEAFGTVGDVVNQTRALVKITEAGGMANPRCFVELAPGGMMATIQAKGISYVIPSSPADTGIFHGVTTNTLEAQKTIRSFFDDSVGSVIYAASTLHSIATGNLQPGHYKLFVVDRSKFAIDKLADRGTNQAFGFCQDAGGFFGELRSLIN